MQRENFKLRPNEELEISLRFYRKEKKHGEEVSTLVDCKIIVVSDSGTYNYSEVTRSLQSAVCTAFDAMIVDLE
jgi:hypothetical protein